MDETASGHIPVLVKTLTEQINLPQEAVMVDATVGHGGHSYLFGKTLGPGATLVGLDIDKKSIHRAQSILKGLACRVILIHSNFSRIAECLNNEGIDAADFILADLGVCSAQLTDAEMGLSFQSNMPLDMRFDKRLKTTAADIVNKADEKSLADLIYRFSQERASRRIARFIVRHRCSERITTTSQLAQIVCRALAQPTRKQRLRIHPATRTFQALRIAVNNELENLKALLASTPRLLKKNGYIAVISYHSLEDRIVKNNFKQNEKERVYRVITKKPIVPQSEEIAKNQRARSAKLRIAQKK
jgi:16S rRNA (cytosine1402-N4)-methyltransferase